MNKKKQTCRKKLYMVLFISMLALVFPFCAVAAEKKDTKLVIRYPLSDVKFALYKVADFEQTGVFELEESFALYKEEIADLDTLEKAPEEMTTQKWRNLAVTLESYVRSKGITEDYLKITDQNGQILCEDLGTGLYLLLGESVTKDDYLYTPSQHLVTLPGRDANGEWIYEIELDYRSKVQKEELYDTYKVQKIWVKSGKITKEHPDEITVELYMDDQKTPFTEVVLNDKNNWEYTFTKLPKGHKWTVAEKNVPDQYRVYYEAEGSTIYIVNGYEGPTPPEEPYIPKTGQLWWPVPILACAGFFFLIMGVVCKKNEEK